MKMRYDIKDMTILQFLEFLLINIVCIPVQLFLFVFYYIGEQAEKLNQIFVKYILELCTKLEFPLKENDV